CRPLIIYNDDSCSLRFVEGAHGIAAVDRAVRHLAGAQVGALCWCLMAGDAAYAWPSKVIDNYYEYEPVDASSVRPRATEALDQLLTGDNPLDLPVILYRQGGDYLPLLLDRTRAAGLKFFGSFRMNDCHHKSAPRGRLS